MAVVDELRIVMDAETAKLTRRLSAADQFMRGFERSTQARLARMDGYFKSFLAGGAAIAGGMGLGGLIEYANAWTRVERSLDASQDIFKMPLHSAQELAKYASAARIGIEEYTKTYFRSAAAIRDLGLGQETAAKMTSTLAMALKLGGATMSEQNSVLLQYSQALNKGKLDGDEFRSVMENAPIIVELLSKRLKVGKGEIISWAAEGKLKVKDLVGALTDGAGEVERIFKRMPVTVDESLSVLRNAVVQYVGERDKMIGGSQALAGLITGTANNIDTVGDSALVASAALLGLFGPRVLSSIATFAIGAGAAASPLGLITAIAAGGAAAMTLFGDKVDVTADGLVSLRDVSLATLDVIGSKLTPALDAAGAAWQVAVDKLTSALAGVPMSFSDIAAVARQAANVTIGVFAFAAQSIKAAYLELPGAVGELLIDMANRVISTVEWMAKEAAGVLNHLPFVEIDTSGTFGRLENDLRGSSSRLREQMSEAGGQIGRDFVGEFGGALEGVTSEISKRAREIADARRWAAGTATQKAFDPLTAKTPPVDEKLRAELRRAYEVLQNFHRQALEATEQYSRVALEEEEKSVRKLEELRRKNLITDQQFAQARVDLAQVTAKKLGEAAEKEWAKLRETTDILANGMSEAFDRFTSGGKMSFREFAHSVIQDMAKMAFKMAVLQPLFGGGTGKAGDFGLVGNALQGVMQGLGFGGFRADGGPVAPGMAYIVGERGKELFVPDAPGAIVPNHVLAAAPSSSAGAAGGVTVSMPVSINAPGADAAALSRVEAELHQLRASLPGTIVATVNDANSRRMIRGR